MSLCGLGLFWHKLYFAVALFCLLARCGQESLSARLAFTCQHLFQNANDFRCVSSLIHPVLVKSHIPTDFINQMFFLSILITLFGTYVQLIMASFAERKTLYETRERHSRTYRWRAFITSNFLLEFASHTVISALTFVAWYCPLDALLEGITVAYNIINFALTVGLYWLTKARGSM